MQRFICFRLTLKGVLKQEYLVSDIPVVGIVQKYMKCLYQKTYFINDISFWLLIMTFIFLQALRCRCISVGEYKNLKTSGGQFLFMILVLSKYFRGWSCTFKQCNIVQNCQNILGSLQIYKISKGNCVLVKYNLWIFLLL